MSGIGKNDETLGELDYAEFHDYLENTVFIVHEVMRTKKTFKTVLEKLYNYMKQGFEREEVRKHPLKFTFTDNRKEPIKMMEIRHFIVNMILWSPLIKLDAVEDLNDSHIFDCYGITNKSYINYINTKIIVPYRREVDAADMNKVLDSMIFLLSRINYDFAEIIGITLDMESFIDMGDKYPRFKELMRTTIPEGMQPREIEDTLSACLDEYVGIIKTDRTNNIMPFIATGKGINLLQFSQFAINGGLKPDIEGTVVPLPIDSSFMYKGLNSIQNFYIDGQAGSKPLILNKTVMGRSGHFAYKTMTLSSNYTLSHTVHDCHSARPIRFHVTDDEHLNRIKGRYWVDENGELHNIDYDRDKYLIGRTLDLRDPVTCCAPDGVCHICYGDAYYTNNSPNFNAGGYAATKINEDVEQKILSSKHMLATNSVMHQFSEDYGRFFVLDNNKIKLNLDSDENFKDWTIYINNDDLFIIDEMNYDGDYNYYTEKFNLVNKTSGEVVEFRELNNHDIYFVGEVASMIKKIDDMNVGVRLDKLPNEAPIAKINIVNNELTAPLKNIIKLLDRVPHFGCQTIDDMVNKLCQLTIDSGTNLDSTHCSMVIKGLVRSNSDILFAPDWSDPDTCDDYQILTLTNALIFNPSLTVSISFESMNKQITNPNTYRKYSKSKYDLYYEEDLFAASKRYYEQMEREKDARKLEKIYRKMKKKRDKFNELKKKL